MQWVQAIISAILHTLWAQGNTLSGKLHHIFQIGPDRNFKVTFQILFYLEQMKQILSRGFRYTSIM